MAERRDKRVKAARKISVGFIGPGARFTGDLVNLSSRGLLIRCSRDVEPGTMGQLGVDMGHETIRIVAVVKQRVPGVGLAFDFSHMGSRDRELLNRLLFSLERKS